MHCKVVGITHNGDGVARINGKATFIPFSIPDEELKVDIIEEKPRYSKAIIKEILISSPDRVEAPCPYYYKCGGCAYQHIAYPGHLKIKQQIVQDALHRIGQIKVSVGPVIGMENPWHYRNKVTWQVGEIDKEIRLGYFRRGSRQLLPIHECMLLAPEITELSQFINCYLPITGIKSGKKVIIRQASPGQELMLIMEGPVDEPQLTRLVNGYPGLESVYIYENQRLNCLFGPPYLNQQIGEYKYQVSPLAFFQVNNGQTKKLYDLVKQGLGQDNKTIVDAYSGTGSIAIYVANQNRKVVGLEIHPQSIEDAESNASLNRIENCEFHQGACEKIIQDFTEEFDTIILDPPRAGCHPELLQKIAAKKIPEILYVSCNPATLARDIKVLSGYSYQVHEVKPVDMFPWTGHVECVVLMSRVKE